MFKYILTSLSLLSSLHLNAALPSRTPSDLTSSAQEVVSGKVINTSSHIRVDGNFSDKIYEVSLNVEEVLKGTLSKNETIKFHYKRAESRPMGWAGNMGQKAIINENTMIKVYLRKDKEGYYLLEPNGFIVQ